MKQLKYKQYDHKAQSWGDFIHEGTFLHWGIDSVESTVGSYTVAVVMLPDGTCTCLTPHLIKFDPIQTDEFVKANCSTIIFDAHMAESNLFVIPESVRVFGYIDTDSLNDFLYKTDEYAMEELRAGMKESIQYTITVKYSTDSDDYRTWDVYEIISIEESCFKTN